MQKSLLFILINICLLADSNLLLELKPAAGNSPGEYRIVKSLPGKLDAKIIKGETKGIGDANFVIHYDNDNWAYYCPRPAEDTFAVRFVPPCGPPDICSLVAFTWIGYNTTTGAVGAPVDVFAHMENPSVDYSAYPGVCEYDGTEPSPLGTLLWSGTSSAPPNMVWDTVNIEPAVNIVNGPFFCGYSGVNVLDTVACLCEANPYSGNPLDVHTYQYNADGAGGAGGWFAYYYTTCDLAGTYMNAGIRAYVKILPVLPPTIEIERLPYSYNTGARKVNIYGYKFNPDGEGIVLMTFHYSINGGQWEHDTLGYPISGTTQEGIWQAEIQGVNAGDTVNYYVVGKDYLGVSDTCGTYTYQILTGTPGNFLYVKNDDDPADILPEFYLDTCDVWDVEEYGIPDSSVLTFYNTIVWRDWGCVALGRGADYGLGCYNSTFPDVELLHSDSTWIKMTLDNGGDFWLSDQDLGYGLGICPDYGQYVVPQGHWVRQYLGIKGMFDDGPLSGAPVTVFGDAGDAVIGDMFTGIGFQQAGLVYIQPPSPCIGNFDSLDATAIVNMFSAGGEIVSYRWTGYSDNYKVYLDFFPFDYIRNPADTTEIDKVAVDSLVEDVLLWFSWDAVPEDNNLYPENMVKLLPMGIAYNNTIIKFYIPSGMPISLSIYDKTGRLIRNLINGKANAGLNSVRWDGKDSYGNRVSSGVYFCHLSTSDINLTSKLVIIM